MTPRIYIEGFVATKAEYDLIKAHAEENGATSATARLDSDGYICIEYVVPATKFDRIRRKTGSLVGTLDRFNNAKRAEEHDRVKHPEKYPCQLPKIS